MGFSFVSSLVSRAQYPIPLREEKTTAITTPPPKKTTKTNSRLLLYYQNPQEGKEQKNLK
jgi:hypothetical protein